MIQSDINRIEKKLGFSLPTFYTETMLNYPFPKNSFGEEFMLTNNIEILLDCYGVFTKDDFCFAIGSDGGEFIYNIKLDGQDTVYIHDLENSNSHNSVEADNWELYLENIRKVHQEIEEDEKRQIERKRNKKWWQFWI